MSASHLLRVRRTDTGEAEGAFVLVNVVQTHEHDKLDLRLVGTDGSSPFVGTIKHNSIHKLKSKTYVNNADDWAAILRFVLLHDAGALSASTTKDLEIVSMVNETLNIVIRKNIGGITQRLGTITLDQNDDVEIALFDWAAQSASYCDFLRSEVIDLQISIVKHRETVARLNLQLDDLVKAKSDHEDQLIQKFAELLNAKKSKIRDQQRMLANDAVEPKTSSQVHASHATRNGRQAGKSRSSKRKAEPVEDESEDDFEAIGHREHDDDDLNDALEAEESRAEMNAHGTPEASDHSATEASSEDEHGFAAPTTGRNQQSQTQRLHQPQVVDPYALPPRRELPFVTRSTEKSATPKSDDVAKDVKASEGDDETDDEL